jgi:hypothetical protein
MRQSKKEYEECTGVETVKKKKKKKKVEIVHGLRLISGGKVKNQQRKCDCRVVG